MGALARTATGLVEVRDVGGLWRLRWSGASLLMG